MWTPDGVCPQGFDFQLCFHTSEMARNSLSRRTVGQASRTKKKLVLFWVLPVLNQCGAARMSQMQFPIRNYEGRIVGPLDAILQEVLNYCPWHATSPKDM